MDERNRRAAEQGAAENAGGRGRRAFDNLKRAARVLGIADEDFAEITGAVQAERASEKGDERLVEQVKKRLALRFHTR